MSEGTMRISGGELTLKFMTATGAAVSLSGKVEGPLAGTFTGKNGQSSQLALTKASGVAAQQSSKSSVFAAADELRSMVIGKSITWLRKSDGETIVWNIAADGSFTARNFERRSTDGGKWEIQDPGALCMKFNGTGDKPCNRYFFRRDSDKYLMHTNRRHDGPVFAEIVSIK